MGSKYILPAVEHLLEDEVDYELKLRKQWMDKRESLEDKKRLLRRLFKEDRKLKVPYPSIENIKENHSGIAKKVLELEESLNNRVNRAEISRLRHYLIRTANTAAIDETEEKIRTDLCDRIEGILRYYKFATRQVLGKKRGKDEENEEDEENDKDKENEEDEENEEDGENEEDEDNGEENDEDKGESDKSSDSETDDEAKKVKKKGKSKQKGSKGAIPKIKGKKIKKQRDEEEDNKKTERKKDRNNKHKRKEEIKSRELEEEKHRKHKEKNKHRYSNYEDKRHHHGKEERHRSSRQIKEENHRNADREHKKKVNRHEDFTENDGSKKGSYRRSSSDSSSDSETSVMSRNRSREEDRNSSGSYSSDSSSEYERDRRHRSRGRRSRRHQRYSSSSRSPSLDRSHYRRSRVQNWDLNFSGDNRSIQVEDFLTRVKKLARHEGVSAKELLMNIHHRLKGEAYDWWFTREDRFTRWEKFEDEIRFRYGNPNRDRGIRAQIREIKQKRGESFIAYVTEVEKLNQCLQRPFSSRTLFELIWENMRPHYRSRLSVLRIRGLEHLIEVNHKIDANDPSLYRSGQPARGEIHYLEADDSRSDCSKEEDEHPLNALQGNQSPNQQARQTANRNQSANQQTRQAANRNQPEAANFRPRQQNEARTATCWNCQKTGHIWRACQQPKRVFCYACGNMGRTTRNCEKNHQYQGSQSTSRSTN